MPDSVNASAPISRDSNLDLHELEAQLTTGSEKNQLQAAAMLYEAGEEGCAVLQSFLLQRRTEDRAIAPIDGRCYELLLLCAEKPETEIFLEAHFPQGVVPLTSESGIDYAPLQKLLSQQNFLDADRVTLQKLCELSGPAAMKRKWVYFSEIDGFPVTDLKTINALWLVHSEGKFGFSVQRQLWLSVGKDWEALWPKIKWKSGKTWTRYPGEFIWNLSAPKGHLPLSNQLRGVQTMSVLLSHPAWTA